MENEIRFKRNQIEKMKMKLFSEKEEQYCILAGKLEEIGKKRIYKILEIIYPNKSDIKSLSNVHISIKKEFIYANLEKINKRMDIDTFLEVHTHPFQKNEVDFSFVDDNDEKEFNKYLQKFYKKLNYGNIVFSKTAYKGRVLIAEKFEDLKIREEERVMSLEKLSDINFKIYDRSIRFMGMKKLKEINLQKKVTIVGVGGLESIIAENLLQMGVQNLVLIDFISKE